MVQPRKSKNDDYHIEFLVKDLDSTAKDDPILDIICSQVLQIARNIRLLKRLGKYKLFLDSVCDFKETFFDLFIKKVLDKISAFFGISLEESTVDEDVENETTSTEYSFPVLGSENYKYFTEMDKLENLIDTSNPFLMKAFEPYFVKKTEKEEIVKETLYARIQKLTKTLFPIHNIIPTVFVEILEERYSKLGFTVKTILVHDYELEKRFLFLQHIFLFKDDMIFPFYRRLFDEMDSNRFLGNHVGYSSFLQDIIVDAYPKYYNKTSVDLNEYWQWTKDPLKGCHMVNIKCRIEWPVDLIISSDHICLYRDLFQFILKIKWALYTLNHLYFTDLKSKKKTTLPKYLQARFTKLKMLRFGLLNTFSSIQHYILGHVFSEFSTDFSKELVEVYNLGTLIKAHSNFINSFYKVCNDFQEYERDGHGFFLLLDLVSKLRIMWRNFEDVDLEELSSCLEHYWQCHQKLEETMNTHKCNYDF